MFMLRSTHAAAMAEKDKKHAAKFDEVRAARRAEHREHIARLDRACSNSARLGAALNEALKERDEARDQLKHFTDARERSNANLAAHNARRRAEAAAKTSGSAVQ